jgi:hypothetical protein
MGWFSWWVFKEGHGGGADLISALPEDLRLEVLVRLRCARAAARTSLLSRRWRGLWTRLPDLTFRDVAISSILAALSSLQVPRVSLLNIAFTSCEAAAGVSLLDSDVSIRDQVAAGVPSMLHAAAGLSPVVFHLDLPVFGHEPAVVDLPPFHRATSMQLYAPNYRFTLPRAGDGFHALEILSLTGCYVDLGALVLRCPCLRVLRVTQACLDAGINIQSKSLQKLFVRTNTNFRWKYSIDTINIDASMLKQLTMSFKTQDDLSVSVVAPLLEKVSWECSAIRSILREGIPRT